MTPVDTDGRDLHVITLTDTAANKVKELLQAEGADDESEAASENLRNSFFFHAVPSFPASAMDSGNSKIVSAGTS